MPGYQKAPDLRLPRPRQSYLTGEGYNVIQALISVGAGGLTGRGFLSGTQIQLHFLRVKYADFIFAVVGEELGFIGAVALICLFVFFFMRGLRAASIARDDFGRLLCVGIVSGLAFQAIVNIAVNLSLSPVDRDPAAADQLRRLVGDDRSRERRRAPERRDATQTLRALSRRLAGAWRSDSANIEY